jgi:ATP-binding cassette subfamily B protein
MVAYATGSATGFLGHIATAATFLLGGWYVLHGVLSLGTLIAFVAYLGRIAASAASLSGLYTGYQRARVSLERVRQLQALPVVTEADATARLGPEARGALRFENLTIRLPRDGRMLLNDVSVEIPAGTKLLLRGASGAGKTTIADLLRRFVDPDSGRILLDGIPLEQIQLQELRRRIVVVEHSPVLFRGTVLDNLRYAHPTVNESAVLQAAILARVDEFVQELPDGYLTQVGEGGASLSTGQRQRIALARASLADPLVVILDEALSGLDHDNAVAVQRALDNSFPQRTRIVITHRDTTIENVDLYWVLDAGELRSEPIGA